MNFKIKKWCTKIRLQEFLLDRIKIKIKIDFIDLKSRYDKAIPQFYRKLYLEEKKKDYKLKIKKARLIFVINRENGGRMDQFLSRDFAVQSRAAHEN